MKISGSLGEIFQSLADTNCNLWHVQEKVYEFESIPVEEKDKVVKQLAILNLERNKCIDEMDKIFQSMIKSTLQWSEEFCSDIWIPTAIVFSPPSSRVK